MSTRSKRCLPAPNDWRSTLSLAKTSQVAGDAFQRFQNFSRQSHMMGFEARARAWRKLQEKKKEAAELQATAALFSVETDRMKGHVMRHGFLPDL